MEAVRVFASVVILGEIGLKLNVCCGGRILPDWVNIDVVDTASKTPDILADARNIPLPNRCAEEIMCIHGFEHFYRFEVDDLINEWKRLLMIGGTLVLELPNLIKCCENILNDYKLAGKHPDQAGLWGLYGDPRSGNPYMNHRWGWTPQTLSEFLREHGFKKIDEQPTQWHPIGRHCRDMRITARLM